MGMRVLVLVLFALALAGCGGSGGGGFTPVPAAVFIAVLEHFRSTRGWKFRGDKPINRLDRHRGFFVYQRTRTLGEDNEEWVEASNTNQPELRGRIASELDELDAYLQPRMGTISSPGPLGGGTDPGDPPHLDLDDMAKPKTSTGAKAIAATAKEYRTLRRARVYGIVYRAAALHDDLWTPSANGLTATLDTTKMDQIVDRRLRVLERMEFQIANPDKLGGGRSWTKPLTGQSGPWLDGFRVRFVEYPRLRPPETFVPAIGASNISSQDDDEYLPGKPWRYGMSNRRLEYNIPPIEAHFPTPIQGDVTPSAAKPYDLLVTPRTGRTAAEIITDLVQPSVDFWGRTWMWCDHTIAALNVEALRFALHRRLGNDDDFNAIVTGHSAGYMMFSWFVGRTHLSKLQGEASGTYFDNIHELDVSNLELGDQVIFWNSFLYSRITSGDWRLENAYIMNVDSDPHNGSVELRSIELQGHGTSRKSYTRYQDEIAGHMREGLADCRRAIDAKLATTPNAVQVKWKYTANRLVRWSPYETFPGRGAWWVRVGRVEPFYDPDWSSVAEARAAMPGTFSHLSPAEQGTGYNPPPDLDSVYFPLWEPRGGWQQYLDKRRTNPSHPRPALVETKVTGEMAPGFYESGAGKPIPVVRPKVG